MNDNKQHLWTFPSAGLKALFDQEICGQISDGAWENTQPETHYHFWCSLDTAVGNDWGFKFNDEVQYGNNRYPKKKTAYNLVGELTNPDVVDLSYRMRAYYVDAAQGFGLDESADDVVDNNGKVLSAEQVRATLSEYKEEYWVKKLAFLESKNLDQLMPKFAVAYDAYTRKALINDLKLIKKQMKVVIELAGNH